ncbi:MAG: helix-turn-helix transcriptional regulator [Ruminococcaceae bacterium]|nr:helix-turn-helix transcriptional regulator [Oscillospiraceae bacterium]
MTHGEQIKKARERKHLTQEALAEQLGVSRQAVSKWEADKARPATSKLTALSEVLELPEDVWETIEKENAPMPVVTPSNQGWKLVTAALAVLLAASLSLNGALLVRGGDAQEPPQGSTPPPVEEPSSTELPTAVDLSTMFPETLTLETEPSSGFEAITGEQVWEDLPDQQEVWSGTIGGSGTSFYLRVVKANPVQEIGTTFWDVYLLCAPGDSRGAEWNLLLQLARENHYVNNSFQTERFSNVLGLDGVKISLPMGASYVSDHYIALTSDNTFCHIEAANTTEFDVDEDGQAELISASGGLPLGWTIYDGALAYTLNCMDDVILGFNADKGGFFADDSQGNILVRYTLRDGQMVRQPLTDITVADYPDVIGTQLTITLSGFSDSVHPDTVLLLKNGIRITPRQQAYFALQELYSLTGLTVPECHCTISSSGELRFTPTPEDTLSFYAVTLPEKYGGAGTPRLELAWQELGNGWSPLKLSEHPELKDLQLCARLNGNRVLGWYYDRLHLFHSGETAHINHQDLWLTDGRRYTAQLRDTVYYGPALVSLYGPYSG